MASQEEDNKLECISNVNKDQESYFLEVYKKQESILNNKNEPFESKVDSLIDIWKTVGDLNLSEFDIRHVIQIMDWAKLHALNIVLTAEWNGFKDTHQTKLIDEIEKAQAQLLKLNDGFATRCKKLADVVKNPWEDPVLMKLMKTKDAEIGPEEIEFFCVETAYLVSVRLKKLCESHCEDLALNLVTAFMTCNKLSKEQNFNLNLSETQMWFIFDIYIALLYKFQEKQKIVVLLKELSFEEGLQLIKRFAKKRIKISKIWKNCQRVAVLALQMYISQAVVKYSEDLKDLLKNYLEIYLSLCNTDSLLQDFATAIRRISNLADASGLYLFCDVVEKMAGSKLKPFVIEMYIRALTSDMNELERQKDAKEEAKAEHTSSRLAAAFCNLAEFLKEHVNVARECVLTAFSLDPTTERLKNIEEFARQSGFKVLDTGQEWKCKLHPPVLPSDEITWICSECGDWMCKPQLNLPKINMTLNEALQTSVLGISEALCDDLVVCLSNPRYQILSWFLPWDDLHRLCIMYLQDPQTTKNFVTELKFVDIDYSIFKGIKKEPVDEMAGIERGYEQYLDHDFVSGEESSSDSEDSMSQDSRPYSLGSDGAGESFYIPLIPIQQKSDPNTLKSLRMFRHNLKRKDKEPGEGIPEKISKQEPSSTITSNTYHGLPETTSLSRFLNGVPLGPSQSMLPPQQNVHSKNVKTATLPLLGGQVARNEIKSIQVHLQKMNTQKLLGNTKTPKDPALKPYNQSTSNNISGILKKELTVRIPNKLLQNGSKENSRNLINPTNSKTQISSQYQDIKTYTRIPQKNKDPKVLQTPTETSSGSVHPQSISNNQNSTVQCKVSIEKIPLSLALTVLEQSQQPAVISKTEPLLIQRSSLLGLNSCQRTQPVDIKYQRKYSKPQETTPSQCNSFNQEPVPPPPQPTESTYSTVQTQTSPNRQYNSKSPLNRTPEKQMNLPDIVDLTNCPTPDRLSPEQINLTLSPEPTEEEQLPEIVDLTLPSAECTDLTEKYQTLAELEVHLAPLVKDTTMPARALAVALLRARKYQERQELADRILHITGCYQYKNSSPPRRVPTRQPRTPIPSRPNLKNKSAESSSVQVDQQKKSQPPAKKVKTADKAVNTCQELYQVQQEGLEKTKVLTPQRQDQVQNALHNQEPVQDLPQNAKEKQSMTCSLTLEQQQSELKLFPQFSKCSPKSDQNQLQLTIKDPQLPTGIPTSNPQLSVVASNKPHQIKTVEVAQKQPIQEVLNQQNGLPKICLSSQNQNPEQLTKLQKPLKKLELGQKDLKSPEKPSMNFSLSSPKSTTQMKSKVLPSSSLNPNETEKMINMEKVKTVSHHITSVQKSKSLNQPLSSNKKELSTSLSTQTPNQNKLNKEPVQNRKVKQQQGKSSTSPNSTHSKILTNRTSHSIISIQYQKQMSNSLQTCTQPLDQIKEESRGPQTKIQLTSQDKIQNYQVPLKSNNLDQQKSPLFSKISLKPSNQRQSPTPLSLDQSKKQLQITIPKYPPNRQLPEPEQLKNLSLDQEKSKQTYKFRVVEELPKQDKKTINLNSSGLLQSKSQCNSNRQQDQSKGELNTTTIDTSSPTTKPLNSSLQIPPKLDQEVIKVDQQTNTSLNQSQLQSDSCNSHKVRNPFRNLEKPLLLQSLLQGRNKPPPPLQSILKTRTQLIHHITDQIYSEPQVPPLQVVHQESVRTNLQTELEKNQNKLPLNPMLQELSPPRQETQKEPNLQNVNLNKPQLSELKTVHSQNDPVPISNSLSQEVLQKKIFCSSSETSNETVPHGEDGSLPSDIQSDIEKDLVEIVGDEVNQWKHCGEEIDSGLFSDVSDFLEDRVPLNNNDYSGMEKFGELRDVPEELPKNSNLTDNIRTYAKKFNKTEKDCVKQSFVVEELDNCNIVNNSSNILSHSNADSTSKELKVVLCRLLTSKKPEENPAANKDELSTKQKCEKGKNSPKNLRRRKSIDKSENKSGKMSNSGQNHNLSPLQDINPRVTPKTFPNSCCDLNKSNCSPNKFNVDKQSPKKDTYSDKKNYARSVLANVPGLNDFEMMRPRNVDQIVNVVQVSGGRVIQNVPIQNSQTSTQITPHIQRIGQPRVPDAKTEHSATTTTTTTTSTTVSSVVTTTTKTTTSQPSTLINILSQQVIRPVTTQTNVRRAPMINILSQQIIRPLQVPKPTTNTVISSESNQAKPITTTAEQSVATPVTTVTKTTATVKAVNTVASGHGGTILQFICKSSLPKFQQAFGKAVYQNNTDTADSTTSNVDTGTTTTETKKSTVTKAVPVNVQPLQGSVIYSRQVPVGQTISLIPPGGTTRQVFRIATTNPEQLLVKDSVIHSKMSALLAAALQGRAKTAEGGEVQINCEEATKVTLTRPTLVQNARIVKPVQLQLPTNVVRTQPQPNLSSTTLEQLREFDMVYKQIKERSSTSTPADNAGSSPEAQEVTPQRISVTYVNQLPKYTQLSPVVVVTSYSSLPPAVSPALSVTSQGSSSPCLTPSSTPTLPKLTTKTSKGKTLKTTTVPANTTATVAAAAKASPTIQKPQQKPQEDEHTTQRIFDILAEYAEQLRNSPDLNNKPAPRRRSNPPTNPSQNSKRKKSSSNSKKSGQSGSSTLDMDADDLTVGSEDSSGGNIIQLSVTDDEQSQAATVTTPESNENSSSSSRQLILTESPALGAQPRNVIIADSSVGEALKMSNAVIVPGNYIMPVSMVKGGQQIAVVSGGSKILATVPARTGQNMLFLQSFTNQNRKGSISAVKYSAIQPISGISSQTLAGVSAQPHVILPPNSVATAVALGQPLALKKIGDDKETSELVLTISPVKEPPKLISDHPQPDSSTGISADSSDVKLEHIKVEHIKLEPNEIESNLKLDQNLQSDNSNEKIFQKYQKTVINSVGTSVIATAIKQEDSPAQNIVSLPADSIKAFVRAKGNKCTTYGQQNYRLSASWTSGIF